MYLSIERFGENGAVIAVSGELDLYSTSELRDEFTSLLAGGRDRIVLDVSELVYLDSSGVGAIVFMLQRVKSRLGKMAVTGLCGMPKKVLEMTSIISILPIYETRDLAEQAVL